MTNPTIFAFLLAGGVLLIGALFAIANKRLQFADQATFITLFIIPLVVLGVASNKIQEFSAPGGLGAKFHYTAETEIRDVPLESIEAAALVFKGADINVRTAPLARAFVLTLGTRPNPYTPEQVSSHIDRLGQFQWTLAIAIVDKNQRFVAAVEPDRFQLFLNNQKSAATALLKSIANGTPLTSKDYPDLIVDHLSPQSTNATALHEMIAKGLKVMIVVNRENTITGVVNRDIVVSTLVDKIATPDNKR